MAMGWRGQGSSRCPLGCTDMGPPRPADPAGLRGPGGGRSSPGKSCVASRDSGSLCSCWQPVGLSTLFCGYITFGCPQACMPRHGAAMVKGVGAGAFPELSVSLVPGPFPCGHTVTAAVPAISRGGQRRAEGNRLPRLCLTGHKSSPGRPHRHGCVSAWGAAQGAAPALPVQAGTATAPCPPHSAPQLMWAEPGQGRGRRLGTEAGSDRGRLQTVGHEGQQLFIPSQGPASPCLSEPGSRRVVGPAVCKVAGILWAWLATLPTSVQPLPPFGCSRDCRIHDLLTPWCPQGFAADGDTEADAPSPRTTLGPLSVAEPSPPAVNLGRLSTFGCLTPPRAHSLLFSIRRQRRGKGVSSKISVCGQGVHLCMGCRYGGV
ncbi:uncharacterized protein LOC111529291 isoform X1 [Piliocolobus tephrosceles]|uniref:uncharacterized protein LOC111529291 isoform X1 n=1 Tax=Piliocolobus tephrosceles TaxID=591936 RepID=UPI000E6AF7A3|nr:uncharacterized protein LOC111529291 isoform X1 [Piliocolobus tephrosceles]XP_026305633.1 uncharacterized protein LOC111529291 isoform X1 [Piliocolobus tephrosceles]XP_031791274.1 uncharacterized protein LOC111529291 isoform X1 [Piliocolobus tephrosceles]XP_031791275.1 uncharacterized protein LOC111529291 isoform X1 [Piliocolobus tephrosceles]